MKPLRTQRGFSLVSAMFVIIVVAVLGAYLLSFGNIQQATTTQALQGTRAWFAARSGLEWAIERAINAHDTVCGNPAVVTGPFNVEGFSVTVSCDDLSATGFREGGTTYGMNQITVTAVRGSDPAFWDYARRTLRATVTTPTP